MFEEISPEEVEHFLIEGKRVSIIDVREPFEFAEGHIPGALNLSVNQIPYRMDEIDRAGTYILVCRSGSRSGVASAILGAHGFTVKNMTGGMLEWTGEIEF